MNSTHSPYEICHFYASEALRIALKKKGPAANIAERVLQTAHRRGQWAPVEVRPDRIEQAIAQALAYKGMGKLEVHAGTATFTPTGLIDALYRHQNDNPCPCFTRKKTPSIPFSADHRNPGSSPNPMIHPGRDRYEAL